MKYINIIEQDMLEEEISRLHKGEKEGVLLEIGEREKVTPVPGIEPGPRR